MTQTDIVPGWQKYLVSLLAVPLLISLFGALFSEQSENWLLFAEVFATVFSIVFGAIVIAWQVGKQHIDALEQARNNKVAELKLQLFEKLNEKIRAVSEASGSAGAHAMTVPPALVLYREQITNGRPPSSLDGAMKLNEKQAAVGNAVADLIIAMEEHEIVLSGGFKAFRIALVSASYDLAEAFRPLFRNLLERLPVVDPEGVHPTRWPEASTDAQLQETQTLAHAYHEATSQISGYTMDLNVACQNELLADLFPGRTAEVRQPIDPTVKVIVTGDPDQALALENHFRTNTPWGAHAREIEADVLSSLKGTSEATDQRRPNRIQNP